MFSRRREEKERMCWQGERGAEGRNANGHGTGEPGQTPGVAGSRAHKSASPFPLYFALKQLESSEIHRPWTLFQEDSPDADHGDGAGVVTTT